MKKIVVTVAPQRFDKYNIHFSDEWQVKYVDYPCTEDQLVDACSDADYLFVGSNHTVSRGVFEKCNLKMVHVEGVGFNQVDVEAAKAFGIPVCNNRAVNNGAVAEHTIGLILAAMRRTALCNEQIYSIGYAECKGEHLRKGENELYGKKVGLIGIGAIGREVAKRLIGWGVDILYYDVFPLSAEMEAEYKVRRASLDEVISESDVISIHVPVLDSTFEMFNKDRFIQMKKSAFLINTARGEVIKQEDLVWALENGEIAGAALDTLTPEPAPADLDLLNMSAEAKKKLTLTPHIGGMTDEAFTRMLVNAIANFERVEAGGKPVNIVNGV